MTRHERMGTIVILVIIALLLAGTVVLRACGGNDVPATDESTLIRFEAEVDSMSSVLTISDSTKNKHPKRKKKSRKSHSPQRDKKPRPEPHKMDPVPRF